MKLKVSEMNSNQFCVYKMVIDECNSYFGGYLNQLDDTEEDNPDHQEALRALTAPEEEIRKDIEAWVRSTWEWQTIVETHFVSLEWLRERIYNRVAKECRELVRDGIRK